jgi:hypothetical protein
VEENHKSVHRRDEINGLEFNCANLGLPDWLPFTASVPMSISVASQIPLIGARLHESADEQSANPDSPTFDISQLDLNLKESKMEFMGNFNSHSTNHFQTAHKSQSDLISPVEVRSSTYPRVSQKPSSPRRGNQFA